MRATGGEDTGATVASIAQRRIRAGDRAAETIPDDVLAVVAWLVAHPHPATAAADALDGLTLTRGLRNVIDRYELALIHAARHARPQVTWQAIAAALRLRSRQGAEQHWQRLREWRASGHRNERPGRKQRSAETRETAWLARNKAAVHQAAGDLVTLAPGPAGSVAAALRCQATAREIVGQMWVTLLDDDLPPVPPHVTALVDRWRQVRD